MRADDRLVAATGHRDDIQGLRAVAVLLVVLDHAGVSFMRGGYVGVDVFFVLSGFLITGVLLSGVAKRGYLSFADFYVRRAKRILPAAALTLVVTMIAAYYLLNYVRARQAVWDSVWAALFGANIHFSQLGTDYFAQGQPPSPIQHYWSLSVEEQFYFVWPALLALALFGVLAGRASGTRRQADGVVVTNGALHRLLLVIVIAGAASLAWSIHETGVHPVAAYFSGFGRAWELALGAMLAICAAYVLRVSSGPRALLGWLGLAMIAVAGVTYSAGTAFPGYAALLPTVGTALVIGAGIGTSHRFGPACVLSTAPLRYVGDRSYALYLWHWPVLVIAVAYAGHEVSVGVKLLLLAGAFLLSIVSYKFFENPIRRARWRAPASAALIPATAVAIAAVAIGTLVAIDSNFRVQDASAAPASPSFVGFQSAPQAPVAKPLPEVVASVKAARRGARIPASLNPPVGELLDEKYLYFFPEGCVPANDSDTTSDICRLGDPSAQKTIVLVGDSHAQMWMPTLLAMAKRDGWAVIPLVKSACLPSMWVSNGYPNTKAADLRHCHAWFKWAAGKARSLRPDVVLATGCCGSAPDSTLVDTRKGYLALTSRVKRTAKSVVLIGDNVGLQREPTDCLLARNATMRTCTPNWPVERFALNENLQAISGKSGFGFLNTTGWYCFQHECPTVVGNTIAYRDTDHISMQYALRLAGQFRTAFRRCVLDACAR
jgi:peptidoglycan/LPS O-acetylase OafA/YrhL